MGRWALMFLTLLSISGCDDLKEYNRAYNVDGDSFRVCGSEQDMRYSLTVALEREYLSALESLGDLTKRNICATTGFGNNTIASGVLVEQVSEVGVEIRLIKFERDPESWTNVSPDSRYLYTCLLSQSGGGNAAIWQPCETEIIKKRTRSGISDFMNKLLE